MTRHTQEFALRYIQIYGHRYHQNVGGARGVIVIVAGYEHGDTSSNPGRD